LLTVALAVVGSQVAHMLAYRIVKPDAAERAHELTTTGHGYLAYLPLALAVCTVLVVVALIGELRRLGAVPGQGSRPSAWGFAVLAPLIFSCQEHFERLVHDGGFPWHTAVVPSFLAGLLLQAPFAIAAYLLARLLLHAVRLLGGLGAARSRRTLVAVAVRRPATRLAAPRFPALALGYGSRGPPASSR
jgi:hypothetical protein